MQKSSYQIRTNKINKCTHKYEYFCPICNIKKDEIEYCPVPTIWKSNNKGKIYIYEKFWKDFIDLLKNHKQLGITQSNIAKITNLDQRGLRRWKNQNKTPKIYSKEEFSFTKSNLYWLGIFYSDGHLRNNGSNYSFSYQVDSSNIFQGYWYPNLLQKISLLFKHKEKNSTISLTRKLRKKDPSWTFKTNLSGISPIFIQLLVNNKLINKKDNIKTSGYSKKLPTTFLQNIKNKEILFQGIFDGDGCVKSYNKSFTIDLSLEPKNQVNKFIKQFLLVPTSTITNRRKCIPYSQELKGLYSVRLAPCSIKNLNQNIYSAQDIVNQLEFLSIAAQHSIRPDKVHELIKIISIICSKEYGEYKNSIPIQREIKNLANERNLKKKTQKLKEQYPIKNNKYLPFKPLWTKDFFSKKELISEAWDPFFNLENLNLKDYPNKERFNFDKGVPIDFKL